MRKASILKHVKCLLFIIIVTTLLIFSACGKGKTTAAIGLAIRAAGQGLRIFIGQFVKGREYGEHKTVKSIPQITLNIFGRECFIKGNPEQADFQAAQHGWEQVKNILAHGDYDIVILDELSIALHYKLISL